MPSFLKSARGRIAILVLLSGVVGLNWLRTSTVDRRFVGRWSQLDPQQSETNLVFTFRSDGCGEQVAMAGEDLQLGGDFDWTVEDGRLILQQNFDRTLPLLRRIERSAYRVLFSRTHSRPELSTQYDVVELTPTTLRLRFASDRSGDAGYFHLAANEFTLTRIQP